MASTKTKATDAAEGVTIIPDTSETFKRLGRRFPAAAVKKNQKGQHYVGIDATIKRFNEVLGQAWNLVQGPVQILPVDPGVATYSRNEKAAVAATVLVSIEALGSVRTGVGGDFGALDDVDKVAKTAQAEAMKKAGHQYGVGLYLWDARERDLVDIVQQGNYGKAVGILCDINGIPVSPEAVKSHWGEDPTTDDGKVNILTKEGLL